MSTDHRDDSEVFRGVLIEEAKGRAGEHPHVDTLVEYLANELDAEADATVQDHLVGCRSCAQKVLDLDGLVTPEAPADQVADLEIETAWRDFQSRLASSESQSETGRFPWRELIAASLLVTTIGLLFAIGQLRETNSGLRQQMADLSQPQVNLPIFYLDELTRSSSRSFTEVEVPPDANYFVLILASASSEDYGSYEVTLLNSAGEETLRVVGLEVSESGGLRLGLSRDSLAEGDYVLMLYGRDGDDRVPLAEYYRRVSYPTRS